MVTNLLETIYERTYNVLQNVLGEDNMYSKSYYMYLSNKYRRLLEEFILEENNNTINEIVNFYVDDEIKFLNSARKEEILSVIDEDIAFEQLMFLSDIAFKNAQDRAKTGVCLSDDNEYKIRLEELADCLDNIKSYNIEASKELLSESILDIDFAFGKSNIKSLRLARNI